VYRYGKSLEQFVATELRAYLSYKRLDHELLYWATHDGTEVDFVIPDQLAIEVKATSRVNERDLRGLRALEKEKRFENFMLVSRDPTAANFGAIRAIPIERFLRELWQGELLRD
jgi:predicted AAA+ superfamily ATPase